MFEEVLGEGIEINHPGRLKQETIVTYSHRYIGRGDGIFKKSVFFLRKKVIKLSEKGLNIKV